MKKILPLVLLGVLLLSGCQIRTVDEMYLPPVRSEAYSNLQAVINTAMTGLEHSAPKTGENQQVVQMADLTGDGTPEYLVYAKGGQELPLHILVFSLQNDTYIHAETIDLTGASFDKVEYAQVDGRPGVELVVGTQVSDRMIRSVSVYGFSGGEAEQLVAADYLNFLTVDLDGNSLHELFVLRAGPTENDQGIVELFSMQNGMVQRSLEIAMSEPASKLKRILVGKLHGGETAVYVASAVDEDTLITDVYTVVDGAFTNVSLSNESGTSIKTMRNYFVYADDIDSDGIMELPSLLPMRSIDTARPDSGNNLIRWYAMTADGQEVDKLHTYHHFINGWYLEFANGVASGISVVDLGNVCDFYIWEDGAAIKAFSIYTLTGQSREEQSTSDGRFVLHKTDSVIYAASLDDGAADHNFTQETVIRSFHLVREYWKTGET